MSLDLENLKKVQTFFEKVCTIEYKNKNSKKYLIITNNDGKKWVINKRCSKISLCLYQPSAIKGKLLKVLLPVLIKVPIFNIIKKILRIDEKYITIRDEILQKIKEVFKCNSEEINLSYFLGTPSIHQKVTIQVSKGSEILGYCKISNNEEIFRIFKHEQIVLNKLNKTMVNNIPQCLYCDLIQFEDIKVYLFIQSTIKTITSNVEHKIKKKHFEFLNKLTEQTKVDISFNKSEYYIMIQKLKGNLKYLSDIYCFNDKVDNDIGIIEGYEIINKAIKRVEVLLSCNTQVFSAFHGDFTPWNMFFEKDELFVFDFEYAKITYPPKIDIFHYFTQVCIFKLNLNAEEIYNKFNNSVIDECLKFGGWENAVEVKNSYCYYLLDIIGLYLERDNNNFNYEVKRNLKIWISLLKKMI